MKKILIGCGIGLVVLAVGGALAILALSSAVRSARTRAMELTAARHLIIYAEGQQRYRQFLKDKGKPETYASSAAVLAEGRDAGGNSFIPFSIAGSADGSEFGGYAFKELKTINGRPIDWSKEFAMCAIPVANVEGGQGRRLFVITTDGIVWSRKAELGVGFVEDLPASPDRAGWQRYEADMPR